MGFSLFTFYYFSQITGTVYYFTNASNRQHFQNYMYYMISNMISELGHINIMIFIGICFITFTKLNYSLLNSFSTMNIIFLCLRVISGAKMFIALVRGFIKARKFSKFDKTIMMSTKPSNVVKESIALLNNTCIICLDKLYSEFQDDQEKNLILNCEHIFHFECFKEWYNGSDICPYCRTKIEL
jgi:hypothetical protein